MTDIVKPYPLITAAVRAGDLATLKKLLAHSPEMIPLAVPGFGSWLHYAAAYGTVEIVEYFLASGFEVNAKDAHDEHMPLNVAASAGRDEIAEFLLLRGATLDTSTSVRNPLFSAIVGRSSRISDLLLERGVDSRAAYRLGSVEQDIDSVAFAMLRGERSIARKIALSRCGGDAAAAEAEVQEGLRAAESITVRP